jgi:RNA polymerase sigma-70 factor (ECF subfamily)
MRPPSHDPDPDDSQARRWLRDAAAGDRVAFERLYRQLYPRLVRFLGRATGRRDVVDDAINDAMLVVWRKAAEFRGDSKVSTWVMGIAYRCMLKGLRSGAPADELNESALSHLVLDELPSAANDAAGHELRDWLAQGLKTLPEEQRTTVVLAYAVGETCESIAEIMGCAVGTVKARLFHARVRLRNVLPALGGDKPRAANGDPA